MSSSSSLLESTTLRLLALVGPHTLCDGVWDVEDVCCAAWDGSEVWRRTLGMLRRWPLMGGTA